MVDFTKDFGYGLLGNNVIGGVVSYVDQIFGDMIMKCKECEQVHSTRKISVKEYADRIVEYYNYQDEEKNLSYYGNMKLGNIIESPKFELDGFLDILVHDLNRMEGLLKQIILNNVDEFGQRLVHGTRREIETDNTMHREILRYWLWKRIRPRTKYKKLKPSLWNYLQRCAKTFEMAVEQGCYN